MLAAVSVTVAMRTVGLLLVSALMVVPVATAQQLTRSFRTTLTAAMALGVAASLGGLLTAAFAPSDANVAPGPTIVLLALAGFVVTWPIGAWLRRRQRLTAPSRPTPAYRPSTTSTRRSTRTSTARTAATSRSGTATTSTTCTTATGTPPTGSTMTSTEPPAGLRPTRQRLAVAEVLASFDDFRSAQDIHELLASTGNPVGLATVYRTLQRLAEAGEVDMLRTEDGEAIYRRCSDSHHHHLVCRGCGRTVEVEGPVVERWTRAIATEHGFADVSHTLEIFGTCPDCLS